MGDEIDDWDSVAKRNYWRVAVRRRWSLMLPFACCGLAGFAAAHLRPAAFRSEAMILVEQQRIPDRYVTPNVIVSLQQRLDSMTQQILGRGRLQQLILGLGLYERERRRASIDDVIDKMRTSIHVEVVETPGRTGELTGFRISYTGDSPLGAQGVTNALVSLFIDENIRARTEQSTGTTAFLGAQLEQARKNLDQQEAQLRDYKAQYTGELPEQQQANLQILASLEAQLFANTASLERAEQQRVYLETIRSQYSKWQNPSEDAAPLAVGAPAPETHAEATLLELQRRLVEMQGKGYLPQHPQVIQAQKEVEHWEALHKRTQPETAGGKTGPTEQEQKAVPPATRVRQPMETALIEVEGRLKATQVEIEDLTADSAKLRARIQESQGRINLAPLRQQQLAEVVRSYDNALANYQSLLQKKQESELASNLEIHQQGERFRILDPATLPRKSESRLTITLMGWVLGLFIGVGLAFIREISDDSMRDLKELAAETDIPVIVRVPIIRGPRELAWHRWRTRFEALALAALLIVFAGTNIQTFLGG